VVPSRDNAECKRVKNWLQGQSIDPAALQLNVTGSAHLCWESSDGEDSAGEPFLQIPTETLVGLDD